MVRLGLVVADYHGPLIDQMEEQARNAASINDATIAATLRVRGAYDTVLPADRLARRDEIDAVVVIGAIISGDTDHDQVIANAVATGLQAVARDRDTPVTFGITGPGMTAEEAADRVEYGADAVESAIDLTDVLST